MSGILDLTALELAAAIKRGETTAVEAAAACISRIKEREPEIHAFITLDEEGAMRQAKTVQAEIEAGKLTGPLAGVPAAVKDNICTRGLPTTCGSRMLEHFIPPYDAFAAKRIKEAGIVILGKTNMDEFAMGSTTETSWYGVTRNPRNPEHVPGGSSGGSCAAVAAGECFMALGSDTGGSIRQPSSFCGVTGIKPTYGTVSRQGLVAYGSSLDQIGPVGKNVADCAALLEVIAGHDPGDSTSLDRQPWDFSAAMDGDVSQLRVGLPRDYFGQGLDQEVREAVLAVARSLKEQGAQVEEFDLGLVPYAIPAYYVIASAEASSNLSRFDGVKYGFRAEAGDQGQMGLHEMYKKTRSQGFGPEVKRRIMLGSFVLSSGYYDAYYLKALRTKALIKGAFDQAFERFDVILAPAAPTTAPRLGESLQDPIKMYLGDIYTVSVNLAGLPAICLPCGTDSKGLPIGVQMIGNCFGEETIIRTACAWEKCRLCESADETGKGGRIG